MAINRTPVLKRCRSLGLEPAFLGVSKKSKKKPPMTRKKVSEYGMQLKEKQKAKFVYGVLEKQFRAYFEKGSKLRTGLVGENLLMLLELRLDSVIYRLGYARTRRESRQVVSHNLVRVNGKKVNIASYQVKVGDVVEIRENAKSFQRFKDILEVTGSRIVPAWLTADHNNLSGTINALPTREQIDTPVRETLIVELYSK